MIHVEFIGLPGAGKTTLAERLKQRLAASGMRAYDINWMPIDGYANWSSLGRRERAVRWLRRPWWSWRRRQERRRCCPNDRFVAWQSFFEQYPATVEQLVTTLMLSPDRGKPNDLRRIMAMCANYQAARLGLRRDDVLVMDEGFLHHQIALAEADATTSGRERLVSLLCGGPVADAVVWVQVDPDLAEQRMARRGQYTPVLRKLDRDQRRERLRGRAAWMQTVLTDLQDRMTIVPVCNQMESSAVDGALDNVVTLLTDGADRPTAGA